MANKTRTLEGTEPTDLAEREAAALQLIANAREGATGETRWTVLLFRLAGPDRRKDGVETRLTTIAIDDLESTPDFIKSEYGDGIYRVRVRRDGLNLTQWDINVELSPAERAAFRAKVRRLDAESENRALVPAAPVAAPSDNIAQVIGEAMRYQADMMRDLVASLRPATPAAPVDTVETIGKYVAMFKGFQELIPRSEAQTGLDMFFKGLSFKNKMGGGDDAGGGGVSLAGMIKDVLTSPEAAGIIKEAIRSNARPPARRPGQAQLPGQRPAAPGQRPRPFAQQPPPGAPAQEQQAATDADKKAMEYLITQAAAGVEPEFVVDTALQLIPQERLNVLDTLPEAQAIDMLVSFYPEAEPHRAWFEALLRAMYEPEGEHVPEPSAGADTQTPAP